MNYCHRQRQLETFIHLNDEQLQKQQAVAFWVGWTLVAIHVGVLLIAFFCIHNAYHLADNGDPGDTEWGADIVQGAMYMVVALATATGGLSLRYVLQKRAET